jgi:hypothetical protein
MTDVARVPLVEEKKVRTKEPDVTFTELVWTHFQWESELRENGTVREDVRREFQEKLCVSRSWCRPVGRRGCPLPSV